jgi:hypothetical protein
MTNQKSIHIHKGCSCTWPIYTLLILFILQVVCCYCCWLLTKSFICGGSSSYSEKSTDYSISRHEIWMRRHSNSSNSRNRIPVAANEFGIILSHTTFVLERNICQIYITMHRHLFHRFGENRGDLTSTF